VRDQAGASRRRCATASCRPAGGRRIFGNTLFHPKGRNTVSCCYRLPERLKRDGEGVVGCQFSYDQSPFVSIGDLTFCQFHLPWSPADILTRYEKVISEDHPDRRKLKDRWPSDQIGGVAATLKNRLRAGVQNPSASNLTGVVCPGVFEEAEAEYDQCCFRDAIFIDRFFFGRSFINEADFSGAEFRSTAALLGGAFQNSVDFSHVKFQKDVSFESRSFSNTAMFSGAEFRAAANFAGATFSKRVSFNNAMFLGPVSFLGTFFVNGPLDFTEVTFRSDVNIRAVSDGKQAVIPAAQFSNAIFEETVDFENRKFQSSLDFSDAQFHRAPLFHGCDLHQATNFPPGRAFCDVRTKLISVNGRKLSSDETRVYFRNASHAYRTLRLAMKRMDAHDDEAKFWELELRAKRRALNPFRVTEFPEYFISLIYALTNSYGNSFVRPLLLWLVLNLVCPPIIYPPWSEPLLSRVEQPQRFIEFSLRQNVRPFDVWTEEGRRSIRRLILVEKESNNSSQTQADLDRSIFRISILASAQSILSFLLIALFVLAIRRKFRLQ
jgi:uncharacterized protein YjbI with pentapeptide repeats